MGILDGRPTKCLYRTFRFSVLLKSPLCRNQSTPKRKALFTGKAVPMP